MEIFAQEHLILIGSLGSPMNNMEMGEPPVNLPPSIKKSNFLLRACFEIDEVCQALLFFAQSKGRAELEQTFNWSSQGGAVPALCSCWVVAPHEQPFPGTSPAASGEGQGCHVPQGAGSSLLTAGRQLMHP